MTPLPHSGQLLHKASSAGGTYLWGVDIGEAKLDLAVEALDGSTCEFFHLPAEGKRSCARFNDLHYRVRRFARKIALERPPGLILVEQPMGRFPNPWLVGAWGVICGALSQCDAPVETMSSTEWKKAVGLHGNAKKEQVMAWAGTRGHPHVDEHQADALGIIHARRAQVGAELAFRDRAAA